MTSTLLEASRKPLLIGNEFCVKECVDRGGVRGVRRAVRL